MISLEAFLSIGLMTGSLLSSFIYAATGATFTFVLAGILMWLGTLYTAVCVPESLNYKSTAREAQSNANTSDSNRQRNKKHELKCFHEVYLKKDFEEPQVSGNNVSRVEPKHDEVKTIKMEGGLFSFKHVKDMWITCFKSRPYYDRSIILLVTGAMFLSIFVLDGAMTVFYLFVREKFQWTIREFSFYETLSHVTSVLGTLIGFLIMRKVKICISYQLDHPVTN